ncbi:MAG TPA: BTAD domain-containing putative transcriptional regulator [Burkholderiales bacterium]|nr:BTAD domain-containing putative transcriptional regulator [Burkholderiales bacterium]
MREARPALAKTTRPRLSSVVPRERLFRALDDARNRSALWLTGPPGSGKTTLAASYVEKRKPASLWYQIDESDADIASFFYYLGLAGARSTKRGAADLPRFTPQHRAAVTAFARRYFQALYRALGADFMLVFDGYNAVAPQALLHDVMLTAISEAPPGACIVIISRSDPPAPMVRLRANGVLGVIGWQELSLTREESDAMALRRRRFSPEALAELYERTRGWAAGVVLMLEQTLAGNSPAAPSDLSAPQLVFDYLAGEIFQNADSATQDLLLATAFVPQMTGEMARKLSGHEDAESRLEALYRNNYFTALKQAQPTHVYEYHPLLREFVYARAQATLSKEKRQALQGISAELLEAEGLVPEAAVLLQSIGDWNRIEALVRRYARTLMDSGRSDTLAQWVEWLPKDVQEKNPWMLHWLAVARLHGSPREARLLQERAYELFTRQPQPDVRGLVFTCSGAMDAILYEVDDFSLLDRWIENMDRLLREHPEIISGALEARITCSLFTSMVLRQPNHPEIEYWTERAHRVSVAQSDVGVRLSVEPRVALAIAWGGHFPKALKVIEDVRRLIAQHDVPPLALTMEKVVEATYFMLTAQGDASVQAAREGLLIERTEGVNVLSRQLIAYGAAGALAADNVAAAEALLEEAKELPGTPARFDLCLHHLVGTWLALRRGDIVRAYQEQKLAVRMAIEVGCPVFELLCRIAAAQAQYEGRELRASMANFQQVYGIGRAVGNRLMSFTGLMAYAHVALESGRHRRSGLWCLREALAMGKPRNYTSYLLWRPQALARLCSIALENDIEPDFARTLIHARALSLDATQSALLDWPWTLKIATLGPFRVNRDGIAIAFSGKAQRRPFDLLKVLIAHGGREVAEERIIEALWPRIDGDSAHRSFNTTLHRLRKLLGEERALVLSEGKLSLDGRYVWVDTWALEQLAAQAGESLRSKTAAPKPQDIHASAERLLGLYTGPFLAGDAEQGWMLATRDRSRRRFARSIGELARALRDAGLSDQAVDVLERAIEADSTAEILYRDLIVCYDHLGRQAEAADTYQRCVKTLQFSLGVTPSAETRGIYEKLLRG